MRAKLSALAAAVLLLFLSDHIDLSIQALKQIQSAAA